MAASDANRAIKNAAFRIAVPIHNITDGSLISSASALDSEISKDGGSFADCTNEATEIGSTGIYTLDLSATEMSAEEIIVQVKTSSTNAFIPVREIRTEPCLDSGVVSATGSSTTILLRSAASSVNDFYNGADIEIVRGTGAGQVRTIVDYVGSSVTATVDRAWVTEPDTTSVYLIHPRTGSPQSTAGQVDSNVDAIADNETAATNMAKLFKGGQVNGSVNDASPTTTDFDGDSGLSSTNDFYNEAFLMFVTGTLAGIARQITDYVGSSRNLTVDAFPSAPSNGDEFVIIGNGG